MKRFAFRLESVLKVRRFELDTRKRCLGVALERMARVEREIDESGATAADFSAEFISHTKQGVRAGRAGLELLKVEQAFRTWRIHQLSLVEAKRLAEAARVEVATANTKVRALERLKERALELHRKEVAREEMRQLDEVAGRTRSLSAQLESAEALLDRSAS